MSSSSTPSVSVQRGGAERVVDVVEAGERELDAGAVEVERGASGCRAARRSWRSRSASGRSWPQFGQLVVAEVGEVDGAVGVGVAAAAAVLGVAGVLELGQREAVVVDAEVHRLRRVAAEVGDQRVVGVEHEAVRAGGRSRPSGRRSSPARRSGRAGRGTGCRAASRAAATCSATWPSQNSSTSNSPKSPVEPRPPVRAASASARRSRPPCSPRRGCGRAARRCARGSRRPSPRSSSCRWWRRSRRCRGPGGDDELADGVRLDAGEDLAGQARAAAAARRCARACRPPSRRPPLRRGGSRRRHHPQRARQDLHGQRQVADRVAVGVGRERAVGARR